MALASHRWGYTSSIIAFVIGLAVWLLQQTGCVESWDAAFYDRALQLTSRWHQPAPKVFTVQIGREQPLSDEDAIRLLEILQKLEPKAIVFDFLPAPNSRAFYLRAAELHNVVLGRELRPDPDNPDSLTLEPWPAAARDLNAAWGAVYLHPGLHGHYRWDQTHVVVGDKLFPTIEKLAADEQGLGASECGVPFLVRFLGGPGSIPNISAQRALAGELIPELVKGKCVLVGAGARLPGVYTPLCRKGQSMSVVEFEANALQTLLDGAAVHPLSGWWALWLLLAVGLVSSVLNPRVSSAAGVRVGLATIAVCVIAAVAALVWVHTWIPLGSLVLSQAGQFAFVLVLKTRATSRALTDMRLHALNQTRQRLAVQDPALSPEYWAELAEMVHHTLNAQRIVLLERVPGTRQLRESDTFGCVFESVQEKGRSLEVPAFAEAAAKGRPVAVQGFFAPAEVPEQEFVCPVILKGEVRGVWCVGIRATGVTLVELEPALCQWSRQIGRLCTQRQGAGARPTLARRFKAWFSAEKQDQVFQELKSTADSLEHHYDLMESALSQVSAATVVYDFFGNPLKANELALALLQPENLSPARATALELLRLVTEGDNSQIQRLLRTVLFERAPASLPIKLPAQGDRHYVLRLNPLLELDSAEAAPESSHARGMVCEIIETTSLSTLASLKGLVADRLGLELRDHLAAMELSASLLDSESFPAADRQMALEIIHDKIVACVHVISECQKYLGRDVEPHAIQCYPVDALDLLGRVCAELAPKAAERRVTLKVDQPRFMAQVLASSSDLGRLFSGLIELLLSDSAENTSVTIGIDNDAQVSTFRFINCGFGIPNERLQAILANPAAPASALFQVLRQGMVWVQNWGGSLEITSEVGQGYGATLQLRQFQFGSASGEAQLTEIMPRSSAPQRESDPEPLEL